MKIRPLGDRVVIRMLETEETTKGESYCPHLQRKNHRLQKLLQ